MADYIVKDTELTSVANAIRTAGGTNSLLSFPNGFVSAVNNISGGSSDFSTAQVTVVNNTGNYVVLLLPMLYQDEYVTEHVFEQGSSTVDAVLYNGSSPLGSLKDMNGDYIESAMVTENAVFDYGDITITGDCTITIS